MTAAMRNLLLLVVALALPAAALAQGRPADPASPAIIFVDLLGGSCSLAGSRFLAPGRVQLLTGVNLPMVIAFLQGRRREPLPALVQGILLRGHRGIQGLPPVPEPAQG